MRGRNKTIRGTIHRGVKQTIKTPMKQISCKKVLRFEIFFHFFDRIELRIQYGT
jgi:hypothetical protein